MRHLVIPVLVMLVLLVGGGWVGYSQVTTNAPDFFKDSSVKTIDDLREQVSNMPVADGMNGVEISAPFIFLNNVRATAAMFLVGVFSFGVLGILFYLLNAGLIGGILSLFAYVGISPWLLFSSGILPHGMFELPALILSGAAVLRMAVALVTPQTGKSMGEVFLSLIADWAKVFIGVIVPLLLVASLIETYVTPAILHSVLNW
jgi:stage II sporulation protein M